MAIIICSKLRNVLKAQVLIVQAGHWHQESALYRGGVQYAWHWHSPAIATNLILKNHLSRVQPHPLLAFDRLWLVLKITLLILYVLID